MIWGKDKKKLQELEAENKRLKELLAKYESHKEDLDAFFLFLGDLQNRSGGMLRVERVSPDSVFLLNPR